MNARTVLAASAALALALVAGVARADDPTPDPKQPTVKVSPAEKKAAAAKRKAAVIEERKKGEIPAGGEATPTAPYKASGTHATRSAERKKKRAEIAAQEKKGEVPHPNEASDPNKK